MTANEKTIATFETRIRQMILRFQQLKKENQQLVDAVKKNEQDLKDLQAKLDQQQSDYQSLRLSKLIRDVNKCIAILSDENQ